jgi:hypothetical protein
MFSRRTAFGPAIAPGGRLERVHFVDEHLRGLHRALRQDAVAEVEDVPGQLRVRGEHLAHPCAQFAFGKKERAGVEVALDRDAFPETLARHVNVDAPVEADDIGAGVADLLEQPPPS